MPKATINYALAATLIAAGATLESICEKVGAKNPNTLRVGLSRKGVTIRDARVLPVEPGQVTSVTMRLATAASEILRDQLTSELQSTAETLALVPRKPNLKLLKQRADVAESITRSAKIVHKWSDNDKPAINLNFITDTKLEDLPSVDIHSELVRVNDKETQGSLGDKTDC